jgi:hypothetical protein
MAERIVYIRRVEKNDRTRLPKDLLQESKRPIGASFNKFGRVLKGITGDEEKRIMPEILGVSANDPGFGRAVDQFWYNINIPVTPGAGVKLNISVDETGYPIAPLDYVKFKFATKHRNVVPEDQLLADHPYALFYTHDPISDKEKKSLELGLRNTSKLKYLELIQDEKRMDDVLSVITSYRNPSILAPDDKKLILENESIKNPQKFIDTVLDKKLQLKSFIYRGINAGVFKESGTRIIYDDEIIGEDLDSAVAFLKSKQGSSLYTQAEGKLNQWELNKV